MGRGWGFLVFCLDFLKGFAPVLAARLVVPPHDLEALDLMQVLAGTAAVVGHCYSIYLRFTGGKGVATGSGAIVAVDWRVFLCGGVVWLVTRFTTRYAGLASILMGLTIPVAVWVVDRYEHLHRPAFLVGACLLTFLILVRHRSNMQRMLAGTEPHIGDKIDKAARNHG
jgi:glycerol-3-phosphate acyltransferase PlsY